MSDFSSFWKSVVVALVGVVATAIVALIGWGVSIETRFTDHAGKISHQTQVQATSNAELSARIRDIERENKWAWKGKR
jgi:hypothetical protein